MTIYDGGKDAGDISVRFHGVQFAGFDQRGEHGPVLGSGLVACEQGIFAAQRDGADSALDRVIVDLDTAVNGGAILGHSGDGIMLSRAG